MCSGIHTAPCGTLTTAQRPPPDTHLAAVFKGDEWSTVCRAEITAALCATTTIIGPQVGFILEDVNALLVRFDGTMDLLMTCINTDMIRLMGRWRSNAILRYLHTTAQTFTEGFAARMVQHGYYALIPPPPRVLKIPRPESGPLLRILWVTV